MNAIAKWMLMMVVAMSACTSEPDPTLLVLSNEGDRDLYYDNDLRWLTLQADGEDISIWEPLCMKRCGALGLGGDVCALGAIYPSVVRMGPGDAKDFNWDGTYYEFNGDRTCYKERRRRADFTATFCYGDSFEQWEGESPEEDENQTVWGATVKDPTCEIVPFERGSTVALHAE